VKYAAIADWAEEREFTVTFMCAQLGVCWQGFYRWRAQRSCQRERTDAELTEVIRQIHAELRGDPGLRRVWANPALGQDEPRAGPSSGSRQSTTSGTQHCHP
jgi:putative transposase